MKTYKNAVDVKKTPQTEKVFGKDQVKNSAGGYVFAVDNWTRLDRFLVLGSEGGTYYVGERKLTQDNAKAVLACIKEDGQRAVRQIALISQEGRAPKNTPAIFALALAASFGNDETKAAAFATMPSVCRTGTHLFELLSISSGKVGHILTFYVYLTQSQALRTIRLFSGISGMALTRWGRLRFRVS
jgi:60 kDa SS-A/Ro ribonucleoprotein